MAKLPIKENEDELDSFTDIKNHVGKDWPYMIKVKRTRDPLVEVRGQKMHIFSSYS